MKFTLSSSLHSSSFQLDLRSSQITTEAAADDFSIAREKEQPSGEKFNSSKRWKLCSFVGLQKNQSNKISVIKIKEPKNTNKSTSNGR
jgi:hypothetical protein